MFVKHVPLCFSPDIDECALAAVTGLQACQANAECRNSPGSFTCSCPAGYVMALDGQGCVGEADVDQSIEHFQVAYVEVAAKDKTRVP